MIAAARAIFAETTDLAPASEAKEIVFRLRQSANDLMDLDKHYQRKDMRCFLALKGTESLDHPRSCGPKMTKCETC